MEPEPNDDAGRPPVPRRVGAYGLVPRPGFGTDDWWVEAPPGWQEWHLGWRVGDGPQPEEWLDDDTAGIRLAPAGFARIDRRTATTGLEVPAEPSPVSIIHPYLASTAIAAATWSGFEAFHAAGFVLDGRVWGILGDRGMGKSTTVAWLFLHGHPIFSDDLLVIRDQMCLAGPRSLDLREGAAGRFGIGDDIGVVGTRRRWRVHLGAVPAELPFAGWVALRWCEGPVSVQVAPAAARFEHLIDGRALLKEPQDPAAWLGLVARPMVLFDRAADWDGLDAAMGLLLDRLAGLS